jgi:alkanesulfonate monooxygenase SsuD/methylene tetrahydromethanopterin reductase-like flavin-dependent oxidoreductase (luciferase family)
MSRCGFCGRCFVKSPPDDTRYFTVHDLALRPAPVQDGGVPLWIGSWGSAAGLRRVARLGDGWLASAYNTTPEQFASANALLGDELRRQGRHAERFPNALVTMWTWITESQSERERILADVLAPLLNRPVEELRERVCVGSAETCAELLSRYASSGCQRVYLWFLGDEPRQIELAAAEIAPRINS